MKQTLVVFSFCIIFSGCASLPDSKASVHVKDGAAVVYGQGGGVAGFIKGVLPHLGTERDTDLYQINGERAISVEGRREYWIKPGTYKLKVYCEIRMDSLTWSGVDEIEATLEAGKEYILDGRVRTVSYSQLLGAVKECKPLIKEKKNA
jgi:hypothetical protein